MNGVHDMGGMHGFGPVQPEANEPLFHARWEARVYALSGAMGAWRRWNIDAGRYRTERLPPADYLRMSYYEKWLASLVGLVAHCPAGPGVQRRRSPVAAWRLVRPRARRR